MKIMTWNVHHATPRRKLLEVVPALIHEQGVDIACIQEVNLTKLWVHRAARALGYSVVTAAHPLPFAGWWEGLAIFSRYPLIQVERLWLDPRRAFLHATAVYPPITGLRIGCLHTFSGRQEAEVARAQVVWPTKRALLAGDFNVTPGSSVIWALGEDMNADGCYEPTSQSGKKLDYVFASPDLELFDSYTIDAPISDHRAVVTSVKPIRGGG